MKTMLLVAVALLASGGVASAQATWAYRGRVSLETGLQQANASSPLVPEGRKAWDASALFAGAADASWEPGPRLRLAGGGLVTASEAGDVDARARELYARAGVTSWMDVEAGKRLVRWGVGYGFSPTGVLDPPRVATDPNDRLGRHEGRVLARADLFRGSTSLTLAGAEGSLAAARLRTVVGGIELALIGSASEGARPSYGASVTHVIGQRLEWHAEMLVHDRAPDGGRTVSGVAGVQYTFGAGTNLVVEYHRNGRGLSGAEWTSVIRGERAPGSAVARRQALFIRAARADSERGIAPELIVIANLDDGGWTVVPAVTWTAHRRLQVYARSTHLAGGPRSLAAFAPWSTALTLGAAARF
jgi:hypothetical protein